ncbi:HNH endonuclease [Thiocapsa roseopersicina]|uniref:HNH endonuclease n=1 Tax=Thiocapsa roseopersicina TaxID=1058 RepID=A0A1H3C0T2_THIRO|nr:HNH endonuclease [Thiocapsa roseopersicina]SDX47680.1 HNH endonuclease [Thiocapsa roseopersicina]
MSDTCILCLESSKPLTEEHIFPEAAGGSISKYLLCKTCNDKLGHRVDAPYVDQKHIQLARATYKIQGKTGKVPQPFSDTYSIDGSESPLQIKLDSNFAPRVVPQAPKVWITENGEIGLSLSRDVRDMNDIPKIIRTTLSRFFKSEDGMQLGWSEEEKEKAIQKSIEGAKQVSPKSEPIQSSLGGSWTIDLKVLFVEHVKVIYEICCLEFGNHFRDSASGQRLRTFLLAQCADDPEPWEWIEAAKHLNVAPQVPPALDGFIKHLTNHNQHTYHVAVVAHTGVVCSMLGMGAVFHAKDLERIAAASDVTKVYLSSINGGKSGIFTLGELLGHVNEF